MNREIPHSRPPFRVILSTTLTTFDGLFPWLHRYQIDQYSTLDSQRSISTIHRTAMKKSTVHPFVTFPSDIMKMYTTARDNS